MNSATNPDPRQSVFIRYNEVALKGKNRGWFEKLLAENCCWQINRSWHKAHPETASERIAKYHRICGRLVIHCPNSPKINDVLSRVFGVTNFSPVKKVRTHLETIVKAASQFFVDHYQTQSSAQPRTFRVDTRRSQKKAIAQTSVEINIAVGNAIGDLISQRGLPELTVNLDQPDLVVGIEVQGEDSYIWTQKHPGQNGLPVRSNSPVLNLISGGIDSPVAALRMLKRGAPVHYIHFHGEPFVGDDVLQKVKGLVAQVNLFSPDPGSLLIVPFGKIQEKIALASDPRLRTILYRRMMIRIANHHAKAIDAKALVTGEALGQVASQTIENLHHTNELAELPVLRPLIGLDKEEIIQQAQTWGTYQTSIQPGIDCCTLFADRHPAIRADPKSIARAESSFPVEEYVQEALSSSRIES